MVRRVAMVLTMTESRYIRLSDNPTVERRLYELTTTNIHTLESLATEHGIDCELERNGALQTLNSGEQVADATAFLRPRAI
jgi:hypothetical protein